MPAENLVGEEGQGFEIAMYGLDQGRFTVAAGACGVVRAMLERSVEYARERQTFGEQIGGYQFVQDMIAEMVLGYETSKLLVMQAAWLKNQGKRNTRETSLAKWHATESAFRAAHLAIQVHGAYGYSAEYGIERYFRNARAPIIYEGTTQIHKMMQAEHALGYRNLNGEDGDVSPIASWAPALAARTSYAPSSASPAQSGDKVDRRGGLSQARCSLLARKTMTVACCFLPCRMRVSAASMCKPKSYATPRTSAFGSCVLAARRTGCSAVSAFFARVASLRPAIALATTPAKVVLCRPTLRGSGCPSADRASSVGAAAA